MQQEVLEGNGRKRLNVAAREVVTLISIIAPSNINQGLGGLLRIPGKKGMR